MASVTIASAGTCTAPTGTSIECHLVRDSNDRRWAFICDSTNTNQVKSFTSPDGVTWSGGATLTLSATPHTNDGRNFSACFKTISANDVVYLGVQENSASHDPHVARGTISGSTLTWGSDNQVDTPGNADANVPPPGPTMLLDSNNRPIVSMSTDGNTRAWRATNTDSGASWTNGWGAGTLTWQPSNYQNNGAMFDLGSGNLLYLAEDASAAETTSLKNVEWSKYNGTSWSAGAAVFTALGAGIDPNNFGACPVTTSDIHCILRTGSNTYTHKRFNGTSWAAGDAITNQNSKAGSGIGMVSDGSSVWMFIIDSDAANTVRYCKWVSGSGWGTWNALETTTQTRNYIQCCPQLNNSTIDVIWTQTNGSNFDVVYENLSISNVVVPTDGPMSQRFTSTPQIQSSFNIM